MQWEIRHLAGDEIVSIRITGEVDPGRFDALTGEALACSARNGAFRFMLDCRSSTLAAARIREPLMPLLARPLLPSRAYRLAWIVGDAGQTGELHDDAPDFDARQQVFSRPSFALYWLAGRKPRPYSGRMLLPA